MPISPARYRRVPRFTDGTEGVVLVDVPVQHIAAADEPVADINGRSIADTSHALNPGQEAHGETVVVIEVGREEFGAALASDDGSDVAA